MSRVIVPYALFVITLAGAVQVATRLTAQQPGRPVAPLPGATIAIVYPSDGSIFPPDMTTPTFVWRDPDTGAANWAIQIVFSDGSPPVEVKTAGEAVRIGEIDDRCSATTNQRPALTEQEKAERAWTPHPTVWETVRQHATERPAMVHVSGVRSHGQVQIQISKDPVGAPIFYRDVPLMPEEAEKGVIRPLGESALPLIAWRLRDLREPRSRVLLTGMPTCANCHSFSADGRTLAMDLDGPANDKGLYAMSAIGPKMSIRSEDVIEWSSFRQNVPPQSRVGFMSQVSPDGQYVVTTVNRGDYVANFKDFRFLQVFYPTRGVLAWYSRASGKMHLLPGADDPRYVHTGAVWSPDGKYLVFARAAARDAYPAGKRMAEFANDPNETQIQYDLYRILFNQGKGGRPEAIAGAWRNGKSNSFPKISPDGRWLVYVQARNGELMRPDSQLYIVPAAGGTAQRMRCNTVLMNSWHSFSPNGRWLVFSSKSLSPYTRMFLTHVDEQGRDSPAIRIENATAANRAVNIPEFVNVPPEDFGNIDVPAVEVYRRFSRALELTGRQDFGAAVSEWGAVVEMAPENLQARNNLGLALAQAGKLTEALAELQKAVDRNPSYAAGRNNLALVLQSMGRVDQAIDQWEIALKLNAASGAAHNNLAAALASQGQRAAALAHWRAGLRLEPDRVTALKGAAWILATAPDAKLRDGRQAVAWAQRAAELSGESDAAALDVLAAAYAEAGRFPEAVQTAQRALALANAQGNRTLAEAVKARIAFYEAGIRFREGAAKAADPNHQK